MIGPQGRCTVCGTTDPAATSESVEAAMDDADDAEGAGDGGDDDGLEAETPTKGEPGSAWDARRLCPNGGCLGVLGADRRCPQCGQAA